MTAQPRCETCLFWNKHDTESGFGDCRRHAPRPRTFVSGPETNLGVYWPETYQEDWCGEWQPKPVQQGTS